MRAFTWCIAVVLALALQGCATTGESLRIPIHLNGGQGPIYLETAVFRPNQAKLPLPLIVLNHGSPRDHAARAKMRPDALARQAQALADLGATVVVPMRRGYGLSDGDWAEHIGSCDKPDYLRAGAESARDIRAVIDHFSMRADIDSSRVALIGVSAGGFASQAYAAAGDARVQLVVSISGGRGSIAANKVCVPDRLTDTYATFARTTQAPSIWLYADKDSYFGPDLVANMRSAYLRSNAKLVFHSIPTTLDDGHHFFARDPIESWMKWIRLPLTSSLRIEGN
jgi:pimeloyl-ACP methyl ester carboxylesterase